MKSLKLFVLPLTLICSGCASDSSAGIKGACAVFEPITYSQLDTPATVEQIERFDLRWLRLCGDK